MIYGAYCVRDNKVGIFMPPIFFSHMALAMRAMLSSVMDKRTSFHSHPADFDLMQVGEFNDADGALLRFDNPVLVVNLRVLVDEHAKDAPDFFKSQSEGDE